MISSTESVERAGDLLDHWVGLGMDGRHVERIVAVADAQKAGGLLEGLGADAGNFE